MVTVVQGKVCAKNHPDRLSRLATIHQRYRRTDGRTDFLWHRPRPNGRPKIILKILGFCGYSECEKSKSELPPSCSSTHNRASFSPLSLKHLIICSEDLNPCCSSTSNNARFLSSGVGLLTTEFICSDVMQLFATSCLNKLWLTLRSLTSFGLLCNDNALVSIPRSQSEQHIQVGKINKSTRRAQTTPSLLHCRPLVTEYISYKIPYLITPLQRRPLVSDNISYKKASASVQRSEKLLLRAHPDPDQHQKLSTSTGSPLAHA